ncbi:MAG: hypothetical protein E7633_08200 [Ruminococcaceae bacterium]|nr:hypothetical protein [Oscillospiraceae bacterium]
MNDTKTIRLSTLTLIYKEETREAAEIIKAAFSEKHGIVPEELFGDIRKEENFIQVKIDGEYSPRRYTIDIDSKKSTVIIVGDDFETLYYAVQRFVRDLIEESATVAECSIDSKMLIVSDPCIITYNGKYYLSKFIAAPNGGNAVKGYDILTSDNLYDWSEPVHAFIGEECTDPNFDGFDNYWAPEICEYKGKFYIFATYKSKASNQRGCAVFRSDKPDGKYELITKGHITPPDWSCIDNSLYVDENGDPWMLFVHEWVSMPDKIGSMCACRMTDDLTDLKGEITTLFYANDAPWNPKNNVTDGPFIYRFESGKLAMIWSGCATNGYCLGVAYSENGVLGPWVQDKELIYAKGIRDYRFGRDGGHGAIFKSLDGRLMLSIHGPNQYLQKALHCFELDITGEVLRIK